MYQTVCASLSSSTAFGEGVREGDEHGEVPNLGNICQDLGKRS